MHRIGRTTCLDNVQFGTLGGVTAYLTGGCSPLAVRKVDRYTYLADMMDADIPPNFCWNTGIVAKLWLTCGVEQRVCSCCIKATSTSTGLTLLLPLLLTSRRTNCHDQHYPAVEAYSHPRSLGHDAEQAYLC